MKSLWTLVRTGIVLAALLGGSGTAGSEELGGRDFGWDWNAISSVPFISPRDCEEENDEALQDWLQPELGIDIGRGGDEIA